MFSAKLALMHNLCSIMNNATLLKVNKSEKKKIPVLHSCSWQCFSILFICCDVHRPSGYHFVSLWSYISHCRQNQVLASTEGNVVKLPFTIFSIQLKHVNEFTALSFFLMLANRANLGKRIISSSDMRALDLKLGHETFQLGWCSRSTSGQDRLAMTPNTCLTAPLSLCCCGVNTWRQGTQLIRTKVETNNPNNQTKPHLSMLCVPLIPPHAHAATTLPHNPPLPKQTGCTKS